MKVSKRRVMADDDMMFEEGGDVIVEPEATELLFETEDVAELVAEVTGDDVEVTADEEEVTFEVGDEEFTVTAEEDAEILESSRRQLRGKRTVSASRRSSRSRRPVSASRKTSYKVRPRTRR